MKGKTGNVHKERALSPWPFALAFGLTASVLYIVCAAAINLWPQWSIKILSYWFHGIDLAKIAPSGQFSISSLLAGFGSLLLVAIATGAIFAVFYNMCFQHCIKRGWVKR